MSLNGRRIKFFDVSLIVAGFRNRILMFLITILLGAGALIVCSARSPAAVTGSEKTQTDAKPPQSDADSEKSQLFKNDPNFFKKSDYSPLGGEFSFRAILAVLFVLALFVAAVYVSKKLLPKITNLPGREIRIVETVHLGPRKAVHVIEIANRRFLIGSTNENVTKLADLGNDLMDLSTKEANFN
jgi:flagellar biosynthetic protein FliO